MHVTSLSLHSFRNYQDVKIELSPGLNVLHGENAQGKTNLLEAIYFLATGKSHRTSRDLDLIAQGAEQLTARASLLRKTGELSLELALGRETRKQFRINGLPERKITRLVGNLAAVFFSPDDLQLIKGAPAARRRFIDIELSQVSQTYLHHLVIYNKVLAQRNVLLKQNSIDQGLLAVYDEHLAAAGAELVIRRATAVVQLSKIASKYHGLFSDQKELLRLEYESQLLSPEVQPQLDQVHRHFLSLLHDNRREELRRQVTVVGPHRDDLNFWINDRDARLYASQGQQRTAILALKLAEVKFMADQIGENPILLLDDVASELDPNRRNCLIQSIEEGIQTLISCTDLEDLMLRTWPQEHKLFRIRSGTVSLETRGLS